MRRRVLTGLIAGCVERFRLRAGRHLAFSEFPGPSRWTFQDGSFGGGLKADEALLQTRDPAAGL
jgi:hypothetical protein